MKLKKILLSGDSLVLVGCDSRIDAVNQQMADIRNQPPQAIEPAPVFTPVPRFNYAAHQLKSPFYQAHLLLSSKLWRETSISEFLTSTTATRKLCIRVLKYERKYA